MSQSKYLVLFRSQPRQPDAPPKPAPSPEQMQKMLAGYKAWIEQFKDEIVDVGDRLNAEGRVVSASGVADGPFVEGKEVVGGYMILAAESFERAVEIMKAGPAGSVQGGSFEIRELAGAEM